MHLQFKTVTAAQARNHSEYLHRAGLTVAIPGDPLYWWHMSVADDGRAALHVDAADMPRAEVDDNGEATGNLTHHSLSAAEVRLLEQKLPRRWIREQTI